MIGQMLGHYRVESKLGEGGMGVVYKARDTHLNRPVAIKVLPRERVADCDRNRRFAQEASALNHPNIPHIYDIDSEDAVVFIAMEYLDGSTLDRVIGRKGLPLQEGLRYAVQIAAGLAAAHAAGVVHRDLKPGNIILTGQGLVKILDFGLAKLTEPAVDESADATVSLALETEEGTILGTAAYVSLNRRRAAGSTYVPTFSLSA